MIDLEVLTQKTKLIVFRRQKNFVCSSVITVSTVANPTSSTVICVRVSCVLNRTTANIFFTNAASVLVLFGWCTLKLCGWRHPSMLALFKLKGEKEKSEFIQLKNKI